MTDTENTENVTQGHGEYSAGEVGALYQEKVEDWIRFSMKTLSAQPADLQQVSGG